MTPVDRHAAKHRWWDAHGVVVERRKLDTGDYMRADGLSNVLADTKNGLMELAMDCGRDHRRFARELDRARDAGFRLVVLVETAGPYHEVEDVASWVSEVCRRCPRRRAGLCDPVSSMRCREWRAKPMQGATLAKIMRSTERDHGCRFEFVHPMRAARRVCELLGVDWR